MTGIRQRIVSYDLQQAPYFLGSISITVTEGIVHIAVLKKDSEDVYAVASVDADAFKTDAQFLIEEIEEEPRP